MPFFARVKDGQVYFAVMKHAIAWQAWKEGHEGVRLIIDEDKPLRSSSQNAYYWVYLEAIARETGDNAADLHEVFKRELLPPVFKTIRGKEYKLPASTTDLDKAAFGDYLDKICALTNIPLPDPEAAGYISNYKI